ncbi:hypothetical protein BDY21DRAFT_288458 [Lineolata rhizophorae]|uniref:RhoGAP-domain-containing protein n=1 Tax=Lineolata rhizophorae TaxID=578093 RepID=A0A6A6NX42_9PEZI|nr:hypothetical protein BDY21DRAFT_288458 [Lineolata rhizophorae]
MSVSVLESPGVFPESPMDQDDGIYPCKGCGEILEEGKAFELAGNRWHIECFRCNTCGAVLDSDSNLLLLGDGSLICNKCTYSCASCGNKIEDLAILTGDQAFCATCFCCRNCKRKIENLRYARTSQGIFCMSCHEALMARRRKKTKNHKRTAPSGANGSVIVDKSLPALPPNADRPGAFVRAADIDTPPSESYTDTPTELSPRPRTARSRKEASPGNLKREASPASADERKENLTLPASTYKDKRHSTISPEELANMAGGDDGFFVPLAFDPNPAPGPSPLSRTDMAVDSASEFSSPPVTKSDSRPSTRDYFSSSRQQTSHRDALREPRAASRSSSAESGRRRPEPKNSVGAAASPHIAYQEKGRRPSNDLAGNLRRQKESVTPSASITSPGSDQVRSQHASSPSASQGSNGFKLQEVPQSRKMGSRRSSKSENRSPSVTSPPLEVKSRTAKSPIAEPPITQSPTPTDSPESPESVSETKQGDSPPSSQPSLSSKMIPPKRGDSLAASALQSSTQRKDAPPRPSPSTPSQAASPPPVHGRKASSASTSQNIDDVTGVQLNGGRTISKPIESPTYSSMLDVTAPTPPTRSTSRPQPHQKATNNESFTAPRAAPQPPPQQPQAADRHKTNESVSTVQSDSSRPSDNKESIASPVGALPRYSAGGDFSMDEDMARIMRGEETADKDASLIRRVSNAVSKHNRSLSDRATSRSAYTSHRAKHSTNGSVDLVSPGMPSPESRDDLVQLRLQLRRAQQKIAELESEKESLRDSIKANADMKQVASELKEKRSTVAYLDTQREMVVKELEVLATGLQRARERDEPLDITALQSDMLQELAGSLQKLKADLSAQIEELIRKRNELNTEISSLIMMKDKGFMEYEALSTRNAQLNELNREISQNLGEFNRLHGNGNRPPGSSAGDAMRGGSTDGGSTTTTLVVPPTASGDGADGGPEPTVVTAPQVVNIRKGQAKKFNWKKGGQAVATVTKGIKGAFASNQFGHPAALEAVSAPYSSLHPEPATSISISSPLSAVPPMSERQDRERGGFGGLFRDRERDKSAEKGVPLGNNGSTPNLAAPPAPEPPSVLFGSELEERCAFEKRLIPALVTRCVQEVQMRGMDVEGIYRKSGGTGQVKQVQSGFERDADYDISDPDLDIHAVTSVLKQYFRRLPTPLISGTVYDEMLEAVKLVDEEQSLAVIQVAIDKLPESHKNTLEFLIFHLSKVMELEAANLMTSVNLAVVFAPTLMRPATVEKEMADINLQRLVIRKLVEHCKTVFLQG